MPTTPLLSCVPLTVEADCPLTPGAGLLCGRTPVGCPLFAPMPTSTPRHEGAALPILDPRAEASAGHGVIAGIAQPALYVTRLQRRGR